MTEMIAEMTWNWSASIGTLVMSLTRVALVACVDHSDISSVEMNSDMIVP